MLGRRVRFAGGYWEGGLWEEWGQYVREVGDVVLYNTESVKF